MALVDQTVTVPAKGAQRLRSHLNPALAISLCRSLHFKLQERSNPAPAISYLIGITVRAD